jgi:hypothetical protein
MCRLSEYRVNPLTDTRFIHDSLDVSALFHQFKLDSQIRLSGAKEKHLEFNLERIL